MDGESTPQAGQSPPDPFSPMHANSLTLLTALRSHRACGARWMEVTAMLAATMVAGHVLGSEEEGG